MYVYIYMYIYTYMFVGWVNKNHWTFLNAQSFPKERLALHGFEVVVPAKEEDRRLGGTRDAVKLS